ncbi:MAG: prepilin-type N-terminal cleavage/methylation domain-containing protein [Candidatus Staskawiczbacteria bacterium]|nr:prepilin-type N-terminal cleavage/methylation domain-containing protein [Candidatus Staskawiczbacteria bacterium]
MVFKLFQNIKKADRGTTLVELIVVVFIIALFSLITVSNFPQIQKQYALSAAAYSLAQDIRAAEDMGLSGAQTLSSDGQIISVKGYGFFARNFPTQGYFI